MTNLNRIAMYCVDNSSHPTFKETDGARCVVCNGLVSIKPVTEEQYRTLPSYSELRLEHKREQQGKAYHSAGITNISSILNYDCSGFHNLTIDIAFMHKGKGFEAVGDAYESLVADIHKLLLESRDSFDLPTHLEGSD